MCPSLCPCVLVHTFVFMRAKLVAEEMRLEIVIRMETKWLVECCMHYSSCMEHSWASPIIALGLILRVTFENSFVYGSFEKRN